MLREGKSFRINLLLICIIPFLLFSLWAFFLNVDKPFNLDEADFANGAHRLMDEPFLFSKNPETGYVRERKE